jgi:hypothetical protein
MTLTDEIQPWLFPVEPLEGRVLATFWAGLGDGII